MNNLLKLISTDEQRMKIVAELLIDGKFLDVIKNSIDNYMWHDAAYDNAEQVMEAYNLLYRVMDSYKHPESYAVEEPEGK